MVLLHCALTLVNFKCHLQDIFPLKPTYFKVNKYVQCENRSRITERFCFPIRQKMKKVKRVNSVMLTSITMLMFT